MKLKPTDPFRTIVAILSDKDFPCMVSLATLATVILLSRTWSLGKNTIVVLEVKYMQFGFLCILRECGTVSIVRAG